MKLSFSLNRLLAIINKEFIQLRRDRLTFAMLIGIPLIQLTLFGFAINSNPKYLPTAIINADQGPFSRTLIAALQNSEYFKITHAQTNEQQSEQLLARGYIKFAINIPEHFTKDMIRGLKPKVLVTADATDAMAVANAFAALSNLNDKVFTYELQHGLSSLPISKPSFAFFIHGKYNPENISQYHIVPGLMGVILTMTMTMITALAITRERERGTMETLLSTPAQPLEVIIGKITPYIFIGYIQQSLIIAASMFIFNVPFFGSFPLLVLVTFPFIIANLSVGLTFSTIAKNQLQALQMTFFFFLPSLLLSGFMFPYDGMPQWAQILGSFLPLTHFLAIVRGIILKGNQFIDIVSHVEAIFIFIFVILTISAIRYRRTLD